MPIKTSAPMPPMQCAHQLETLLTPAIDAQASHYRRLGLQKRILTLPWLLRCSPDCGEMCQALEN